MDDYIIISWLNDFIFCPVSIYFHQLYGKKDKIMCQTTDQINGTHSHDAVDEQRYSSEKSVLQGREFICEKYRLVGKIDTFDIKTGVLTERKKRISNIYDGYIFQIYAQYFCLEENGYSVKKLRLYSMDDNKSYSVAFPEENSEMLRKFEKTIEAMRNLSLEGFVQTNQEKCKHCIYEPACDRSLL